MRTTLIALVVLTAGCSDDKSPPADGQASDSAVDRQRLDGEADQGAQPDGPASDVKGDLSSCGDPAEKAAFPDCIAADDQSSCEGAGGEWKAIGLYPEELCVCPTGQGDCPCLRSTDCLGPCVAPMGGTMFDCSEATEGTCTSVSPIVGCWCWFQQDGSVQGLCAD